MQYCRTSERSCNTSYKDFVSSSASFRALIYLGVLMRKISAKVTGSIILAANEKGSLI